MARSVAKDHDEKRRAILATAAKFFAENGYDRASMAQLAKECHVSKALIYHYYAGKELLLFDILESYLGSLLKALEGCVLEETDAQADLEKLVLVLLDKYRGADHQHRLQLEAMGSLTADQQKQLALVQRKIVQVFADVIVNIHPEYFAADKHRLYPVTMSLFGMLNWFYQWHRHLKAPGKGISRESYGRLATGILISGLRNL